MIRSIVDHTRLSMSESSIRSCQQQCCQHQQYKTEIECPARTGRSCPPFTSQKSAEVGSNDHKYLEQSPADGGAESPEKHRSHTVYRHRAHPQEPHQNGEKGIVRRFFVIDTPRFVLREQIETIAEVRKQAPGECNRPDGKSGPNR